MGASDGFDGEYNVDRFVFFVIRGCIELDEVEDWVNCYNVGFMHTMYDLDGYGDDEGYDMDFRYSIKPIRTVEPSLSFNYFLKNR